MQTTNGTFNGAQARSGLTGQPRTHVNGASIATPVVNNHPTAMRAAHHDAYAPQGAQAQPNLHVQHPMPNINGIAYEMTLRGSSGAPLPVVQGHAQLAQQAPQGYQWRPDHKAVIANGWNPRPSINNNHTARHGRSPFISWSVGPQPGQLQHPQQHQTSQPYQTQPYSGPQNQNPQQYQLQQCQNPATDSAVHSAGLSINQAPRPANDTATSFYGPRTENQTVSDTPPNAANAHAVNAPGGGAVDAVQPSTNTEGRDDFQNHVNALVEENGATFVGRIRSAEDYQRYKLAVWRAKRSGGSYENKAQDYPKDESGQMRVRKQIFDAFVNLGGEQDAVSETADFDNCLAVRMVRALSPLEVELLVQQFMEAILKVQSGEPVTAPDFKVVQASDFATKVSQVVDALKRNKLLCRSAIMADDAIARIVADPVGERRKKTANVKNNSGKSKVLAAENQKKGTARKGQTKTKTQTKGKGNRVAAEVEAALQNEAGAEVDDVVRATQAAA